MNISKLFRKPKQIAERWQNSPNWWKAPILDSEYGEYDYFIEDVPENENDLYLTRYTCKCEECGKERHLYRVATGYFRTMDGYDSVSFTTCARCEIKLYVKSAWRDAKEYIKNISAWIAFNKFYKLKAVLEMNTDYADVEYPIIEGGKKLNDKHDVCEYIFLNTCGKTFKSRYSKFRKEIQMWNDKDCRKMLINAINEKLTKLNTETC